MLQTHHIDECFDHVKRLAFLLKGNTLMVTSLTYLAFLDGLTREFRQQMAANQKWFYNKYIYQIKIQN